MAGTITASLDVMGGDKGAEVVLPGADLVLRRHDGMRFRLFGDEAIVRPLLDQLSAPQGRLRLRALRRDGAQDDKPSQALRRGRGKSSMWRAIEAVKEGAGFAVSAGNTGALMAMALFCLRGEHDIDRPAIAGVWPTLRGEAVVLDIGATIGADAEQLFEYAVMGAAMARALFDKERPTVGLLNIGVEEVKGLEEIRLAGQMLKEADLPYLDYVGFVEGDDIGKGTTDVVVTEGFAGNIALKTAEGTARQITTYLRQAMERQPDWPASAICWRAVPSTGCATGWTRGRSNGGVFLGLGGLVIKSHGGTDAEGFASAIEIGYSMARERHRRKDQQRPVCAPPGGCRRPQGRQYGCAVSKLRSVVLGAGGYLPEKVLTNEDLAKMVDTSDAWIRQRTGIAERHIAADGEVTSDLAAAAARVALDRAGVAADDIDLIVLATSTPDNTFPAAAVTVQEKLGMTSGAAFDIQAVCSGFVYALTTTDAMIRAGQAQKALVIGAETFSRILDWTDRGTCVLFGDGAGAVVLAAEEQPGGRDDRGILTAHLRSDGRHKKQLYVDGGPSSTGTVGHLRMEGREVFKYAVSAIGDVIEDAFDGHRLHARGHRLVRAASGQYPHHRRQRQEVRHSRREGDQDGGAARQHLGGVDPAGAGGGQRGRTHQARRSAAAGSRWAAASPGARQFCAGDHPLIWGGRESP